MNKEDFFDRFIRLLENTKERYGLDTVHDALIVWFGENYLFLDSGNAKESIVQDQHAEGVDAILIDRINYELLFVQAKTVDSFDNAQNNFSENAIKSTLEGVRFLLSGNYKKRITPDLENLVDEYHALDKTCDYKTKILFLTLKNKPVDIKFIENFRKDFPSIEVCFYDFDWLFDFYVNEYLIRRDKPPGKISFEVLTNLLKKNTPNESRVFTCKAKELARVYDEHRERIFQQNVRYSLGLRSRSINKKIYETAVGVAGKSFWYFNNGITIICDEINESANGKVINLKNAQIINGAQTTYALYEAYQKGEIKDDVEVLIKAIESRERNFIESVTLYTNSQNAIRLRDLSSNEAIQIRIQKILLESYKYFYERKRGEFDSLYPSPELKKGLLGDDYKTKVISNENATQSFLAMFPNKPAQAKSEKGRIFMKDEGGFYDEIFKDKDDVLAEKILMSWKLLKYIEVCKKEYSQRYRQAENLSEGEKTEIYKYDFLLHSEYFILNVFKDFLKAKGLGIDAKKDDLLKVIRKIDEKDSQIQADYETIKNTLADYINDLRKKPGYYHNKFFKNETSIALVRNFFNQKYDFIEAT